MSTGNYQRLICSDGEIALIPEWKNDSIVHIQMKIKHVSAFNASQNRDVVPV